MINRERCTLISPLLAPPAGLTLCVAKCASATPFVSRSYALFHFPYPASPLLATRLSRAQTRDTKTAGVCTNSSQIGTQILLGTTLISNLQPLTSVFSHYSTLFCTLQNLNPFVFKQIRTLLQKHPGGGWGRL